MKEGDLVNFYSSFAPFLDAYQERNPGIVVHLTFKGGWGGKQYSAHVLWANGDQTTEYHSYLRRANEGR